MTFRPILPEGFTAEGAPPDFGPVPMLTWLKVADLVVDATYQREIGPNGRANIRRIIAAFSWCRFSPVIVAPVEGGRYAVIDGQHRTTAAAALGLERVPCQVVVADRVAQADAFTAVNAATTKVHPQAIFAARVAGGEPAAVEVNAICRAAGVRLMRSPVKDAHRKPGDTNSIGAIEQIFRRLGADTLAATLGAIMKSGNRELPEAFNGTVLRSLAEVLADHKEWRTHPRLAEALDRIDIGEERERASRAANARRGLTVGDVLQAALIDKLSDAFDRMAKAPRRAGR
jgi:hypothetical protein